MSQRKSIRESSATDSPTPNQIIPLIWTLFFPIFPIGTIFHMDEPRQYQGLSNQVSPNFGPVGTTHQSSKAISGIYTMLISGRK